MTFSERLGAALWLLLIQIKIMHMLTSIEKLISDSKVAVDFLQGGPVRQAKLINRFQAQSKNPHL
jgi:hypothetical protein